MSPALMIDSHFHIFTQDTSTPEKRAERAEQVRRDVCSRGVEQVCLIGLTGSTPAEARGHNQRVASFVDEHPDIFHGWARVDPTWGEDAVVEFRRAIEEDGLIGLKLYADAKLDDPVVEPLAEAAVDMDVPIISHVAHRTEVYEGKPLESTDENVRALAESFPNLLLISGHIGGGGQWERRIKNIAPVENVYLDTSGSVTQAGMIEMAAEYLGVDRLVFGTDTWFLSGLGKLEGVDLEPEEKARIGYRMNELLNDGVENKLTDEEVDAGIERATKRFAELDTPRKEEIVDANAFVGHYPFRNIDASPSGLLERMDRKGVDRAIVSSMHSLLYKNPHSGNEELAEAIDGYEDRLIPFATLDPTYPAWETDLEMCLDKLGMHGVKLLPAYHDYDLGDDAVVRLFEQCTEHDVPVMIAAPLEDQRGRHPRIEFRDFEGANAGKHWSGDQVSGLIDSLSAAPEADVIICNVTPTAAGRILEAVTESYEDGPRLQNLVRSGATLFAIDDMRMFWPNDGETILSNVGVEHLVCAPRFPMRVFDSHHHVRHLDIDRSAKDRIRSGNVLELLE